MEETDMRRLAIGAVLLLAGCAAPVVVATISRSQQAVTAIELEYVNDFLIPAASYDLLPRCPQPQGAACSDAAIVTKLRDTQVKLHNTIYALRDFTDASPQANAADLIANARAALHAAEAILPAKRAKP
jgi:hypothetical protein